MSTGAGRRIRRLSLDANVGKAATFTSTGTFISLHTGDPLDDGSAANEVTTTTSGYVRQTVSSANWTAATVPALSAPSISATGIAVTFGPSSGANAAWGTITFVGVWDNVSATAEANFIGRCAVTPSQVVGGAGQSVSFAIGAITLTDDDT